jgi:LmbE family N-acetylglucosaminyl deacetylase
MSDLSLLAIFAHPDDESLGIGGLLARYAAEGVSTHLITATRGQRGWVGDQAEYPGPDALGKLREGELESAAKTLGIQDVVFLDYMDGDVDQAHPHHIIPQLVTEIRRIKPQVVITFDPFGAYGHPDHIAISQFSMAAVVAAADASYTVKGDAPPHQVAKFYYFVDPEELLSIYEALFGDLKMDIDGVERRPVLWKEWAITTKVECSSHIETVLNAIACHRSQLPDFETMRNEHEPKLRQVWATQYLYRVYSMVNGGRRVETDIFEGLR